MKLCFWCCHPIDGEILRMPFKHDRRTDTFKTMGQFCSWSCMVTYNRCDRVHGNILVMRKRMTGRMRVVPRAPDRYALEAFGGTMTIEEFRTETDPPWVQMPNMYPMIQSIEASRRYKPIAAKPKAAPDGDLVMRRPIPLKRDANTIESLLNIKKHVPKERG